MTPVLIIVAVIGIGIGVFSEIAEQRRIGRMAERYASKGKSD